MATPVGETAPAVSVKNKGMLTAAIMVAVIMQVLDTTIANVALPHMRASLGASQDEINWVLTSYIVAAAIATPLTGWFADRIGRRKLLLGAVVGFTMASLLCGVAANLTQMVLFRIVQGICGAMLVPLAQATMMDINPREKLDRPWRFLAPASCSDRSSGRPWAAGSLRRSIGALCSSSICPSAFWPSSCCLR